jgi:hypothetical protein
MKAEWKMTIRKFFKMLKIFKKAHKYENNREVEQKVSRVTSRLRNKNKKEKKRNFEGSAILKEGAKRK